MNKFVFITHVTPAKKRNSLRQRLFELYRTALLNQTYSNWFVIQLHEGQDEVDEKFFRFHLPDVSSAEKAQRLADLFRRDDFVSLIRSADYLVKLDDDDLISPEILHRLAGFRGDLYYDTHHTFYDISSGIFTQQQRPWVASTCVHKTEYALAEWNGEGASAVGNLLYTDHSKAWHQYYSSRNIMKADFHHPVYARVLSPTSITSGSNAAVQSVADVDFEKYYQYLLSFGEWKPAPTTDFDTYREALSHAWKEFSGREQRPIPTPGSSQKILKRLDSFVNKLKGKK